ncbi:hypothetical protein ACFSKL_14355 [Belliella marina]|uniref:Uncharacterized protein n=1 Tax=Belliella marina TaxID=1644146 RepID=A0ABW4VRR9_9BACT
MELKAFYRDLVPEGFLVRVRFDSKRQIDLFVYEPTEVEGKRNLLFQQWDLDIKNYKPEFERSEFDLKYNGKTNSFEEVKERLNWTNDTFEMLYKKLKAINCIGISNSNPFEIEYGFRVMGVYSYLIFDDNLPSQKQVEYTDECTVKFYKDNIVFAYGSGAFGSLCTAEFKKDK